MREVLLNGVYYRIHSDIRQTRINPWKAKLGASGAGLTYHDFQNAEIEEYHDFRNGIGKKRALGSDARLDFSEGIDFSIEGQAVLGPLINTADYATWEASTAYSLLNFRIPTTADGQVYECTTAGTSGASEPTWDTTPGNTTSDGSVVWTCRNYLAPIKIIDFQDNTYVIQNSRILKWDGANLDCVDNSLSDPIDAIVVTDLTDEYLIVCSASQSIYTTDGSTWNDLREWHSPTGFNDPDTVWSNEAQAYDDDTATNANTTTTGSYLELTLTSAIPCNGCRIYCRDLGGSDPDIAIDLYYEGAWNNIFSGTVSASQWVTKLNSAGMKDVSKARIKFNAMTGSSLDLYEFDFSKQFCGYLTYYNNKLFSISTDGKIVQYSAAKDIDDWGGHFYLLGDFGTAYSLFTGKLLADDTPVPYFTSTKGLFSVDTTNEIAYRQEVNYAPLTNAGRKGLYWNANIWVATGAGISKVAPSVVTPIGADLDDGLPSGYRGDVYDIVPVGNWLVFCVNGDSSDKSSIFKRNATLGGNLQVYTTSAADKAIACLHHSPSSLYTNGRLWFGEDTDVKYMMFPDTTHNVKQISTYEYVNDSGRGDLPIFRKLAAISKTALGVGAITKSCDANNYIEVLYGLNGAAPSTSHGDLKSSPRPSLLPFNSGLGTEFYTIQLAVKFYRDPTKTNSPELESLMFYYLPTPATILAWQFRIQATDDEAADIISQLETIRDTNTLVTFFPSGDPNKTSHSVKLTQLGEQLMFEEQGAAEGYLDIVVEQVFEG